MLDIRNAHYQVNVRPVNMPYCDKCDKMFATRQSLWKHRQRKHVDQKKDIIGKIINNAVRGGGLDNKSSSTNLPPKKIEFLQMKMPGSRRKVLPTKVIKPKTLSKTAMDIETDESDVEENEPADSSDNASDSKEYDEVLPDTSEKLIKIFQDLQTDFNHLIENLNLVLGELKRADVLSSQECKTVCNHLKEKINFM